MVQIRHCLKNLMISILSFVLFYFLIILFNINITSFWNKSKYYKTYFFIFLYFITSSIFILILHFQKGKYLFFVLFDSIKKTTIIKDPQEFLYVLGNTGILILICWFFIYILLFSNIQIMNIFRIQEYSLYLGFISLLIYYFFIALWLFFNDLITAHWEIFYQEDNFDFQPDLESWYKYYKGESFDLFVWLNVFLFYFIFLLFNNDKINLIWYTNEIKSKNPGLMIRFLPFILILLFSLSFFGGESIARDATLIFLSFCISEFLIYSKLVFQKFKQYR